MAFRQVFLTPKYLGVVMEYGGMDLGAYLKVQVRHGTDTHSHPSLTF